jgi:8-oxo-dGTP diphosphatase
MSEQRERIAVIEKRLKRPTEYSRGQAIADVQYLLTLLAHEGEPVADLLVFRSMGNVEEKRYEVRIREEEGVRILQHTGRFPLYLHASPVEREPVDVVAGVRLRDGKYWVCKRNSDGDHAGLAGLWEYPGGKVEPDEQLRDALKRELKEEFPGCRPRIGDVLDSIESRYEGVTYRVTFFMVEMDDPTETPTHSEVGWFSPAEVCRMAHLPSGTIFNARHLASPQPQPGEKDDS